MYRTPRTRLLAACLLALSTACSQKDPDTAGGTAGAAGSAMPDGGSAGSGTSAGDGGSAGAMAADGGAPPDGALLEDAAAMSDSGAVNPDDYYPLIDGAEFTFRHIDPTKAPWDDKSTFSTTTYEGKPAFLSAGSTDPKGEASDNILLRLGTKIFRVSKTSTKSGAKAGSVTYEPGFLRFDTTWVGKDVGFAAPEDYHRIEYDAAGSKASEEDRSHTFTIEAVSESITVPAGKLDGCMRVRRERMVTAGATTSDDDDKRLWFCPGIGKAKELTVATGATEELAACKVPGRACP